MTISGAASSDGVWRIIRLGADVENVRHDTIELFMTVKFEIGCKIIPMFGLHKKIVASPER